MGSDGVSECRSLGVPECWVSVRRSLGLTTVTLQRDPTTVVIKGVPAEVCGACGEYYLSEDVSRAVMALGERAVARGAEVEILRFAA